MTEPNLTPPKASILMKGDGANLIYFDLTDPKVELIRIGHIAYGLAHVFRYAGQSNLTVAQHSVAVSRCVPGYLALQALLHDAAEAYVGDMPAPLKKHGGMEKYNEIENLILFKIFQKYAPSYCSSDGVVNLSEEIKSMDLRIRIVERRVLWPKYKQSSVPWTSDHQQILIDSGLEDIWSPERAEYEYLKSFSEVF